MTAPLTIGLTTEQTDRLARIATRLGRKPADAGTLLFEEALRMAEYDGIEFRDSAIGRLAYVRASSLAVWEVVMVARDYAGDAARVAEHLGWPLRRVETALAYARAFSTEIDPIVDANAAQSFESLRRLLPDLRRTTVRVDPETGQDDVSASA